MIPTDGRFERSARFFVLRNVTPLSPDRIRKIRFRLAISRRRPSGDESKNKI